LPSSNDRGAAKGKPKRRAPSIRDAAASAAGSTGTVPGPRGGSASAPLGATGGSRARKAASPKRRAAVRRPSRSAPAADDRFTFPPELRPEPGFAEAGAEPASRPPIPDFETTAPDGDFDPQRTLGDWLEAVIPPEAQVHFIRAGKEFAAGIQTTVDHHLGRGSGAPAGRDGASRIEIE
jgi:hypothetical protein